MAANPHRILATPLADVYPLYVAKLERKGRTTAELDAVIGWLTGFSAREVARHLRMRTDFTAFFAQATMNPARRLITGKVCGVSVETVEDPTMQAIRYLDKLVDELARGRPLAKVLRTPV